MTDLEFNPLVIVQRIAPTNLGMVDEQIFSATVDRDKAKALIAVEPFDGSLCHALNFLMLADLEEHTAASLPDAGLTLVRTVGSGVALLAAPLASQGSSASSAAYGVTSPRPARRPERIVHGRNRFRVSATFSKAPGFCTVGQISVVRLTTQRRTLLSGGPSSEPQRDLPTPGTQGLGVARRPPLRSHTSKLCARRRNTPGDRRAPGQG